MLKAVVQVRQAPVATAEFQSDREIFVEVGKQDEQALEHAAVELHSDGGLIAGACQLELTFIVREPRAQEEGDL